LLIQYVLVKKIGVDRSLALNMNTYLPELFLQGRDLNPSKKKRVQKWLVGLQKKEFRGCSSKFRPEI